jgi:hypothetical protein
MRLKAITVMVNVFYSPETPLNSQDVAQRQTVYLRRMPSSGILRHVALVKTDVSEERSPSFIRVTRIGELGTTLLT